MSAREKINQKATKITEAHLIRIRQVQVTPSFDDIHRIVNDVLAELTNYKLIPLEKWLKIVELIKNRPKFYSFEANHRIRELRDWFEVLEAEVAELKEDST